MKTENITDPFPQPSLCKTRTFSQASKRSPFFDLNWCILRPLLKRLLCQRTRTIVTSVRDRFQPAFSQYSPIPLIFPSHYKQAAVQDIALLPTVSIVTPSYNQGQFLERTMKSILEQSYPKLEYIVQDGGSTDGTQEILRRYASKLNHYASHKDAGQAQAINIGFRQTSGEILAWLNADDLLLPGAIQEVVRIFSQNPEVDVVYGHRICINAYDYEIGRWLVAPNAEKMLPWANYIPQETLFWRRRIWDRAGGYVDNALQFAMDWELLLRFLRVGAQFARLPRFLGAFRVHASQKSSVCQTIGRQEAAWLHQKTHGYPITWLDVRYHVRQYLALTACLYTLYYLRLRRY